MVGVLSDLLCVQHSEPTQLPHIERCELVRHCRWVDEVVPEAPWRLDEVFIRARRIDYVAIDEGASVNPAYEKERVRGYDTVKRLSKKQVKCPTYSRADFCDRQGDIDQAHAWSRTINPIGPCHSHPTKFSERDLRW